MNKPYAQMTPREHIIETVVSRIKCGRASDIHASIEGLAETNGSAAQWYASSTYAQRERLIRAIKRRI